MTPQPFPLYAATSAGGAAYLGVGWRENPATGEIRPYLVPVDIAGIPYVEMNTKLRYWRPEQGAPDAAYDDDPAATHVIPMIRDYWPDGYT